MYRKKYVYICDECGRIDFPQTVQRGDITDTVALPDGWRHIGGRHLCGECSRSAEEILGDERSEFAEKAKKSNSLIFSESSDELRTRRPASCQRRPRELTVLTSSGSPAPQQSCEAALPKNREKLKSAEE